MKEVNLISIINAHSNLNKTISKTYFEYFNISPRGTELVDLTFLIKKLLTLTNDIQIFDGYYFGYVIPQISKEFDLLRIGKKSIVNIELKTKNTGSKIFKQMIRNRYYLGFLNKKVYNFTYVSDENRLYSLDAHDKFYEATFEELLEQLESQSLIQIGDLNKLFNPSNYLVSPLNSTDVFIENKYFLTSHQEEIKEECLKRINKKGTTFLSISGKAGTGKTLLTFDIVKEFIIKKDRVLIFHCGILNRGHNRLITAYGWEIVAVKDYNSYDLSNYELIIIDECQRIFPYQFQLVVQDVKKNNGNCIFSFDKQQCLKQEEINNNISEKIAKVTGIQMFELTEKIRTNKEIASFIIALFNKSSTIEKINRDNIGLSYFKKIAAAKQYIQLLGESGWKIVNYTKSNRHRYTYDKYIIPSEDNAHGVIGQEFDKVVAVIDSHYFYNGHNLAVRNYENSPYYHPVKMLFQIMTRTRLKLHVIIIDNEEIMERCLDIINPT